VHFVRLGAKLAWFGVRNVTSRPIYPTRSPSHTVIAPLRLTFALNRAKQQQPNDAYATQGSDGEQHRGAVAEQALVGGDAGSRAFDLAGSRLTA
jgi:hypothetical protein